MSPVTNACRNRVLRFEQRIIYNNMMDENIDERKRLKYNTESNKRAHPECTADIAATDIQTHDMCQWAAPRDGQKTHNTTQLYN